MGAGRLTAWPGLPMISHAPGRSATTPGARRATAPRWPATGRPSCAKDAWGRRARASPPADRRRTPPMPTRQQFSPIRTSCTVLAVVIPCLLAYAWGGPLWHPLFAKMNGQSSVGDRIAEIVDRQPDLAGMRFADVAIVVYKEPLMVRVYNGGALWEEFPMTARSG